MVPSQGTGQTLRQAPSTGIILLLAGGLAHLVGLLGTTFFWRAGSAAILDFRWVLAAAGTIASLGTALLVIGAFFLVPETDQTRRGRLVGIAGAVLYGAFQLVGGVFRTFELLGSGTYIWMALPMFIAWGAVAAGAFLILKAQQDGGPGEVPPTVGDTTQKA